MIDIPSCCSLRLQFCRESISRVCTHVAHNFWTPYAVTDYPVEYVVYQPRTSMTHQFWFVVYRACTSHSCHARLRIYSMRPVTLNMQQGGWRLDSIMQKWHALYLDMANQSLRVAWVHHKNLLSHISDSVLQSAPARVSLPVGQMTWHSKKVQLSVTCDLILQVATGEVSANHSLVDTLCYTLCIVHCVFKRLLKARLCLHSRGGRSMQKKAKLS